MSKLIDLLKKEIKNPSSKKIFAFAYIFGLLFGISLICGHQFSGYEATAPGIKGKALILLCGLGLSFLFLPVTYLLFKMVDRISFAGRVRYFGKIKSKGYFFISWAVIWLCWLPAFLAYYPAIMSYDFNRQFGEAVKGYVWFYEYQPLAHTFLIRMFYLLGLKLGSLSAGMAVFALLQSLILSSAIAAGVSYVYIKTGAFAAAIWTGMFAILPFNPVLAISMTKDILFSAFFAFIILILIKTEEKASPVTYVLFVLIGILNILFRNNAAYALIFLVPAFLISGKNFKKKIICALIAFITVVLGLGCKSFIRESMQAIPGSEMEKYNVPIVQMARVVRYQEENLSDEQAQILRKYLTDDTWGE